VGISGAQRDQTNHRKKIHYILHGAHLRAILRSWSIQQTAGQTAVY
jgi:hypothetical protein